MTGVNKRGRSQSMDSYANVARGMGLPSQASAGRWRTGTVILIPPDEYDDL